MLKTAFWRKAAGSLPAAVRSRYIAHFEDAERFDLVLDAIAGGWKYFTRLFATRHASAH